MQLRIIIMIIFSLSTINLWAKDLGVVGPTYKISETNLLQYIYNKLNQIQKDGKLEELQQEYTKQIQKQIERPVGSNIRPAIKNRQWLYDPSLALHKDIYDDNGNVVAKKGTVINPLSYITLSKDLLFINADLDKELDFAKIILKDKPNTKIILVNGNILETNKNLKLPVYFDQAARLSSRFGINNTPAIVKQLGSNLEIREVAL